MMMDVLGSPKITKFLKILIGLAVAICFIQLVYAAVVWRPLIGDGGLWTFHILNNRFFNADWQYLRYADFIWQFPAVTYIYFFGPSETAVLINNLFYNLAPFVCMGLTFLVLKKMQRTELFVFPMASFAMLTQTIIARPFTLVASVLAMAWLLFVLLLGHYNNPKLKIPLYIMTGLLCLAHESVGVFFGLIAVLNFIEYRSTSSASEKSRFRKLYLIFGFIFLYYFIKLPLLPNDGKMAFGKSIFTGDWDVFRFLELFFLILFVVPFWKPKFFKGPAWIILSLALFVSYFFDIRNENVNKIFTAVYMARTWAFFLATLLMLSCLSVFRRGFQMSSLQKNSLYFVLFFSLSTSIVHDYKLTEGWMKSADFIKSEITKNSCVQVNAQDTNTYFYQNGFNINLLPFVSLIYQVNHPVTSILFSEEALKDHSFRSKPPKSFCCPLAEGKVGLFGTYMEYSEAWSFDLRSLMDQQKTNQKNMCD